MRSIVAAALGVVALLDERVALVDVERVAHAVAVAVDFARRHAAVRVALPGVGLAVAVLVELARDEHAALVACSTTSMRPS